MNPFKAAKQVFLSATNREKGMFFYGVGAGLLLSLLVDFIF